MTGWLSIALLGAMAVRPPAVPVGKSRAAVTAKPQAAGNFTLTVSPATISFSATNPGTAPVVAGSSPATASWSVLSVGSTWNLQVQATSPTFANCSTVPVSAVTVTCSSVSVTGIGGSGTCSGAFPLSTGMQTVASGSEGLLSMDYSVTISFTLADNWKYIAEMSPACTLSLNYLATAQ